jgi:hypothetical protein
VLWNLQINISLRNSVNPLQVDLPVIFMTLN